MVNDKTTTRPSEVREGFPDYSFQTEIAEAADPYGAFIASLRDFLDAVAEARPTTEMARRASLDLGKWSRRFRSVAVPEVARIFARRMDLPGRGQTMAPAFHVRTIDKDAVSGDVSFGQYFLGTNHAVHGGALSLLFDDVFGRLADTGRPPSRTAFLHTDFRAVTPVNEVLTVNAWVEAVQGRKRMVRGTLHHGSTLCAHASGLFVELRDHQQ